MRKTVVCVALMAFVVTFLAGCGGSAETASPIELVPQSADMVAYIDMAGIMNDADLTGLYDAAPKDGDSPQTFADAVARVRDTAGLDLRDLDEAIVVSGGTAGAGLTGYSGAIVKGTFEKGDLIAAVQDAMGLELESSTYKDHEVYTDPDQDASISFLADDIFVIGTPELVEDVIDIKRGDEPTLGGDVMSRYDDLGDVLVKVAASVPPEQMDYALGEASGLLPFPIDLSSLAEIEMAGMTLDRAGESIILRLELDFSDPDSAETVEGLIALVKLALPMMAVPGEGPLGIPIPEEALELLPELLDRLDVSTETSVLTIRLEMPLAEIEALLHEQGAP